MKAYRRLVAGQGMFYCPGARQICICDYKHADIRRRIVGRIHNIINLAICAKLQNWRISGTIDVNRYRLPEIINALVCASLQIYSGLSWLNRDNNQSSDEYGPFEHLNTSFGEALFINCTPQIRGKSIKFLTGISHLHGYKP
jgi:hypothetical protein